MVAVKVTAFGVTSGFKEEVTANEVVDGLTAWVYPRDVLAG
jgi:hypothetical protein